MRATLIKGGLAACLLLFVADAFVSAQGQANIRYLVSGRERYEEKVSVAEDSYRQVQARRGASRFRIKPVDIISIEYTRGPSGFAKGRTSFNDGDYAKAIGFLNEALASSSREKWLPIYGRWYLGRALARTGDLDKGIAALEEILKESRDHRLVPMVYAELAELHMRKGSAGAAEARDALRRLEGLKLGGQWDLEVELGQARVDLGSGKSRDALARLEKIQNEASTNPKIAQRVRLEMGKAYVSLKDYAKAEAAFLGILDARGTISEEARAGACNGLGDCQLALGKFEAAFKSYSRTFVWFKDADLLRAQVGWALYGGGEALIQLSESKKGDEKTKIYSRGKRLLRKAVSEFSDTNGGARARKALGI